MKHYKSFEDIEYQLACLKLERRIALEEMKLVKSELTNHFKPTNWISTIASIAGKYGFYLLLKRFFR